MLKQTILGVVIALAHVPTVWAQACLQEVIGSLYADLEAIDVAGENRLKASLDKLAKQEAWNDAERSEFTLKIADNPDVDDAEARRTDILGRMFSLAQRGESNCSAVKELRDEALAIERAQWDAAVGYVEQRIWR